MTYFLINKRCIIKNYNNILKYSSIKRKYVSLNLREIIETTESDLDSHGEAFPKRKLVDARYVSPFTRTTDKVYSLY